eukprot:sb/3474735/
MLSNIYQFIQIGYIYTPWTGTLLLSSPRLLPVLASTYWNKLPFTLFNRPSTEPTKFLPSTSNGLTFSPGLPPPSSPDLLASSTNLDLPNLLPNSLQLGSPSPFPWITSPTSSSRPGSHPFFSPPRIPYILSSTI